MAEASDAPRSGPARPASGGVNREQRAHATSVAAYQAFRARNHRPYVVYASIRLGADGMAESVVAEVFTDLAISWRAALASAEPAAVAWQILGRHVDDQLGRPRRPVRGRVRGIAAAREDALLLRNRMRLSSERAAEVMGLSRADFQVLVSRERRAGPVTASAPG
ncbi:hypothetical protein ACIP88_36305 [Streptomyces uncialis]|uniref:hypothetical protein n=1 Tax=Streptomyces uncialis TaxID=1048205 RepID=UPI00382EB5A8